MVHFFGYSFKDCLLISIRDRNADDDPCAYMTIDSDFQADSLVSMMVESPDRFGMVVEDIFSLEGGKTRTLMAVALDLIPEGIDYVVVTRPMYIDDTWHIAALRHAGVAVLIDAFDLTPFDPVIPEDAFLPYRKCGLFWKIVPDDVRGYLKFLSEYERDRAIMRIWNRELSYYSRMSDEKLCYLWKDGKLSSLIETLSFGSIQYEQVKETDKDYPLPKWLKSLVEEKFFYEKSAYTDEFNKTLKAIEDVFCIWHSRLSEEISYTNLNPDMFDFEKSRFKIFGREFGIDRDIEALLAGVPVEDILAA